MTTHSVSQPKVSPENLGVLAELVLTKILYAETGETTAKPEYNLGEGADTAFARVLSERYDVDGEPARDDDDGERIVCALNAATDGFGLGIHIAACVASNPLDFDAAVAAVKEALKEIEGTGLDTYLRKPAVKI